ncbi:uncharacterized protein DNG_04807 [Cephalotrichum gorgonifer]|uniref:Uncharacterized protein n=1 Tax=Cephalotrichum gorgonifer TaxID=2041049 RepID=A0AAE8MYK6_9PEZI|nr:uncharacterized protein DNG_04807 [Cephalotrichum gorgonifer]
MPAKSDFSIRKLIPQRQRGDHDTNTSTHEHHRHWLHPNLKHTTARRGSAELPMKDGTAAPGDRYHISAPILPESSMMSHSMPSSSFERMSGESVWSSVGSRACSPAPGLGRPITPRRPWSPAEASRPSTPIYSGVFPPHEPKAGEEADVTAAETGPRPDTGAVRPRRPSSPLPPPSISTDTKKDSYIVPVTVLTSGWIDEEAPSAPVWKLAAEKKKKAARTRRSNKDDGLEPRREKHPRWTFTENVTELFTGQLFKRMEAEETITPEQVDEFRRRRESAEGEKEETLGESEAERLLEEERKEREEEERWLEGLRAAEWPRRENDGDETPQEPFYLDHLSSAIEAMLASTAATSTPGVPAEESGFGGAIQRDFSVSRKPMRKASLRKRPLRLPPSTPLPAIPSIPVPPRNPARQGCRAPMPTIPEVRVTPAGNPHPTLSPISLKATEDEDFVFLQSTPCTLTMPSFRHGPVRIAKSDLGPVIDVDDTLDWTAFQMAILGAGDFFCDSPVFCSGSGSEEEEVVGLEAWCGDLELGVGALVGEEEEGNVAGTKEEVVGEEWNLGGDNEEEGGECEYGDEYEDGEECEYGDEYEDEEEAVGPSPSTEEFPPPSCSSSCYSGDDDLPIPLESEFPPSLWSGTDGRGSGGDLKRSLGRGIRRWAMGLPPRRDSRSSAGSSLPKSPMLTIDFGAVRGVGNGRVVTGRVAGGGKGGTPEEGAREMVEIRRGGSGIGDAWSRGEDVVPMGCNLGNDLGDFLRWEADNVYAVEVFGARMLRRQPTTLSITAEDIAAYEDNKAREAERRKAQEREADAEMADLGGQGQGRGQGQAKTREERIGVPSRGRGRGRGR